MTALKDHKTIPDVIKNYNTKYYTLKETYHHNSTSIHHKLSCKDYMIFHYVKGKTHKKPNESCLNLDSRIKTRTMSQLSYDTPPLFQLANIVQKEW